MQAIARVQSALTKVVAYDVRERIEVPRFMTLKSQLLASDMRALARARLAVTRDATPRER